MELNNCTLTGHKYGLWQIENEFEVSKTCNSCGFQRKLPIDNEYENIDCSQDITISHLYFHAYDKEGYLLDVYPSIETKSPNTISAGGKKKASIAYGLNSDEDYIKLQFYNVDYSDMSNPTCTYKLEW